VGAENWSWAADLAFRAVVGGKGRLLLGRVARFYCLVRLVIDLSAKSHLRRDENLARSGQHDDEHRDGLDPG
jgi:hypothetical protein